MVVEGPQLITPSMSFPQPTFPQPLFLSPLSQLRNQQLKAEGREVAEELAAERQRSAHRLSSLEAEVVRMVEAVSGSGTAHEREGQKVSSHGAGGERKRKVGYEA